MRPGGRPRRGGVRGPHPGRSEEGLRRLTPAWTRAARTDRVARTAAPAMFFITGAAGSASPGSWAPTGLQSLPGTVSVVTKSMPSSGSGFGVTKPSFFSQMHFRSVAWADTIDAAGSAAVANAGRYRGIRIIPGRCRGGPSPFAAQLPPCGADRPAVALRDGSHASRDAPRRSPGPFGGSLPAAGGRRGGHPARRGLREPGRRDPGVAPDGSLRRQRRVGHGPAAGGLPGRAGRRLPARGAAGSLRRPAAAPRAAAGGRRGPGGLLAERRRDAAGVRAARARNWPRSRRTPSSGSRRSAGCSPNPCCSPTPALEGATLPAPPGACSRSRPSATWAGRC